MLLAGTRQGIAAEPGGWRPDPRATLTLAGCGAVVLCLAFLGLLYRPITGNRPALLTLSVIHGPRVESPARRPGPHLVAPAPVLPPALTPLPPIPGFTLLQEQVDEAVRETVSAGQGSSFLLPSAPSDLSRALQAPEKPATLQQGQSYRTEYGNAIVKSGQGCTAMQQVQVGPVAKAGVGFMVPCPGEYRPGMADALADWADKRAQGTKPPQS